MKPLRTVLSKIAILLLAFFLPFSMEAQTVSDSPELTNWTRFLEDCKINPAFAGLNGDHVVTAAVEHNGSSWIMNGIQTTLSYQNRIKTTGTGYKIGYVNRNLAFFSLNEVHAAISHSIRLSKKHQRFLGAGVETYVYSLSMRDPQPEKWRVRGLPALNAGLLYTSQHFYGGIILSNIKNVYWTVGTSPPLSDFPVTPSLYAGYKTKYGIATLSAGSASFFTYSWPQTSNIEAGLLLPVKKVLMVGAKYNLNGTTTGLLSYMSNKRLRGGLSYSYQYQGSNILQASMSCVLGKKD